jgi:hypothetical protein
MPHAYDANTKYLVQTRPADWLALCGRTTMSPVEIVDSDLSAVTSAADRVLRILEDPAWLLHLELQSSRDLKLLTNLLLYNTLLERRHGLPVRTLVVLLRPSADFPEMTGVLLRQFPGETPYLTLRYDVIRLWQLPASAFLDGGLGVVPLAPLGAVTDAELPAVIGRMGRRIALEAAPAEASTLWTAAEILMGLRYPKPLVSNLLQGIHKMNWEDSVTYVAIVEKGIIKARRDVILRQGRKKFGQPSEAVITLLASIDDPERLANLVDRVLDVSTWDELLAPSSAS